MNSRFLADDFVRRMKDENLALDLTHLDAEVRVLDLGAGSVICTLDLCDVCEVLDKGEFNAIVLQEGTFAGCLAVVHSSNLSIRLDGLHIDRD